MFKLRLQLRALICFIHKGNFAQQLNLLDVGFLIALVLEIEQFSFEFTGFELVLLVTEKRLQRTRPRPVADFLLQVFHRVDHIFEPVVFVLQRYVIVLLLLYFVQRLNHLFVGQLR